MKLILIDNSTMEVYGAFVADENVSYNPPQGYSYILVEDGSAVGPKWSYDSNTNIFTPPPELNFPPEESSVTEE